ncbi:hypothetical protein B0H17DRAFT_1202467 [Mycena rosella]|uniref:Uncharacterized protein n=1 Tax=Mycena rosella TaxID=1033263 RepID=A0AAD7DDH2_MYCRO|nr:hypothetical protein B0H17DRAFT_1202467 [Mycena rosella]
MTAITVMLVLALTEIIVELGLTALSMRSLYSAVQDATDTISFSKQQASLIRLSSIIIFAEDIILVTNNAIADSLFIYRCYVIWSFNKRVISLPVCLLLITTVLGYRTVYRDNISSPGSHTVDSRIDFAFAIVTNLTLTGHTAGRIWWTRPPSNFALEASQPISLLHHLVLPSKFDCGMQADTAVFETGWDFAAQDVLKTAIALFFNGFYVLLVIFSLYFLRRQGGAGHHVLICAITVMFIFATTEITLQLVTATLSTQTLYAAGHDDGTIYNSRLDSLQRMSRILGFIEHLLLVTNNTVTHSFLIYCCYVIWGTSYYKKRVVVFPLVLLLSNTIVACVNVYRNDLGPLDSHFDFRISFGLGIATNLLVAGLMVGRIWWTRRHLQTIGQTKFIQRYNTAMSMLLESCVIYSIASSLIMVALSFNFNNGPISAVHIV